MCSTRSRSPGDGAEYLEQMDRNLGVNVGNLIGPAAVRRTSARTAEALATDGGDRGMQDLVRDGMKAGARSDLSIIAQPEAIRPAKSASDDLGR